ncbi:MAG: hypothetical protein WB919_23930, partial [Candidatus Sulfotelmatobacter sp.]
CNFVFKLRTTRSAANMLHVKPHKRWREWVSIFLAIAIGPAFLLIGNSIPGLIYRAAAGAYFLCCVLVVPIPIFIADRFKFLAWQLAIGSLALTLVEDNLKSHAMRLTDIKEIAGFVFALWIAGTLLSSPLPIYILVRRKLAERFRC